MTTNPQSNHEEIKTTMDRCRAGRTVHVELPEKKVSIHADREPDETLYTFLAETNDRTTEIEAIVAWKLISDHESSID